MKTVITVNRRQTQHTSLIFERRPDPAEPLNPAVPCNAIMTDHSLQLHLAVVNQLCFHIISTNNVLTQREITSILQIVAAAAAAAAAATGVIASIGAACGLFPRRFLLATRSA